MYLSINGVDINYYKSDKLADIISNYHKLLRSSEPQLTIKLFGVTLIIHLLLKLFQ